MKHISLLLSALFVVISCKPTLIDNDVLGKKNKIFVFNLNDLIPKNSQVLNTIKLGRNLFYTNCISYDSIIYKSKIEALRIKGNAIKVIEHRPINAFNKECHKLKISILKIDTLNISKINVSQKDNTHEGFSILKMVTIYKFTQIYLKWSGLTTFLFSFIPT